MIVGELGSVPLAPLPGAARGLTSAEAALLLARIGPNAPARKHRFSAAAEILGLLANPLVLILVAAAVASAFLRELAEAGLILAMVAVGTAVNFAQTYRSRRAANLLRERVAPTATVLRDGEFRELRRELLVPGDVVRLSAGDLVPADARLLEARDLHVQQAALTGESMPAEKEAAADGLDTGPSARNRVFLGTSVVSGTALAAVVATGPATAFGGIASRLAARPPETEFERGLRRFAFLILRVVVLLVGVILVASLSLHRDPLESLLFAVALAVGLTPEFLPMIASVTLARGAVQMARENVIVKRLSAIQDLGSIDVLCSDKTGTLTAGQMSLERAVDALGRESPRPLLLGAVNSRLETGIKSPLDAAILEHQPAGSDRWSKLDEIPFDFERRRLSIVARSGDGERLLITKGAPESVLAACVSCDGRDGSLPFDAALRERSAAVIEQLERRGLRVIAVAWRAAGGGAAWTRDDEAQLTLAGYLAFSDPPLPEAASAIAALRSDGVAVKILTGDSEPVARTVCAEVGLDPSHLVTGDDLERVGDTALGHLAESTTVFARVTPAQKNRILLALKRRGHVVGFLGDGINDAPALHTADVGISVPSAADVAREAADLILLRRDLRILHRGILAGRRAFGNVTKYLLMGTSSNFGNMVSMACASLVLPFLPMLPAQILLNNLLYDLAQVTIPSDTVDETYLRGPQRWDIHVIRNFMIFIGPLSSLFDFLTFAVLLLAFHAGAALFHTGWFVESLATQTLVLFVIRTRRSPFASRPSAALAATALLVVAVAVALPFSPAAPLLGFVPLPASYLAFVAAATLTYLMLVELAKRRLMRLRFSSGAPAVRT